MGTYRPKTWTEEQLIEAVKTSTSYRQVLSQLCLIEAGGNYATIKKWIKKLDLDISHFTHQGWSKGQVIGPKRPLEDYLSNRYPIQTYKLNRRLLREGIFPHQCQDCRAVTWKDSLVPLELHHINGNSEDNTLSNLQLLCPNCHAQTDTYRGKNKKQINN